MLQSSEHGVHPVHSVFGCTLDIPKQPKETSPKTKDHMNKGTMETVSLFFSINVGNHIKTGLARVT
jgi:hypothetical protein